MGPKHQRTRLSSILPVQRKLPNTATKPCRKEKLWPFPEISIKSFPSYHALFQDALPRLLYARFKRRTGTISSRFSVVNIQFSLKFSLPQLARWFGFLPARQKTLVMMYRLLAQSFDCLVLHST